MSRFSVVINTYNRAKTIGNTLKSLRYLRHPSFEVIVVNGPSDDGTDGILDSYRDFIRIGHVAETNISQSRNVGISMAKGEFIAFIDDDAVPELNWLEQLERHYHVNERLGGVGGFVRNNSGVEYQCKYIVCDRQGDAEFFNDAAAAHIDQRPFASKYYSLIGVNSSFRKKALLEIGGFDEEYAYFLDETDVCARLTDAGWLIRHVPDAEVYHNFAPSFLRDDRKVPSSLHYVARSKTYFAFRNAISDTSLANLFNQAEDVRSQIRKQAWHLYSKSLVTDDQRDKLLADADRGYKEGIHDSFAYPQGQSTFLVKDDPSSFKPMVSLLPASDRQQLILISQDFPPRVCGGVGVFMKHLAVGLAEQGHEISVITRSEGGHTVDFEDGVWVHRIPEGLHLNRQFPPLPDLPDGMRNYAYSVYDEAIRIQQIRGATTTISSIWDLEGAACVASSAFTNLIYLVTTYKLCLPSKPEWQSNPHFLKNHVQKMVSGEKWILEKCDKAIASTPGILRDVQVEYGLDLSSKTSLIPFGIPPTANQAVSSVDSRLKILFVGRLEKRKGAHVLLEAMTELLATSRNIQLQLVGNDQILVDGETIKNRFYRENPQLLSDDRILFLGQVDDEKLCNLYSECDIFVAPSLYESFGLIFLEAMRESKPCIGTSVGGIPDVLSSECGILVAPDDVNELKTAIQALASDPAMRLKMGRAGKETFDRKFSLSVFVDSVNRELEQNQKRAA